MIAREESGNTGFNRLEENLKRVPQNLAASEFRWGRKGVRKRWRTRR